MKVQSQRCAHKNLFYEYKSLLRKGLVLQSVYLEQYGAQQTKKSQEKKLKSFLGESINQLNFLIP